MTLYEVHSALARSLGDPFAETALSTIYDGVRYSKQARQGYLYRACCSIINEVVTQLAPVPREQATEVAVGVFPSMVSTADVLVDNNPVMAFEFYSQMTAAADLPAYFLNAHASMPGYDDMVPIPIVSVYRANKLMSRSSRGEGRGQLSDSIVWISDGRPISGTPSREFYIRLYHGSRDLMGYYLSMTFIRYPLNQDLTDGTVEFDFESSYMNAVLNKATLYGMTDGGDLTPEQILPLLAK